MPTDATAQTMPTPDTFFGDTSTDAYVSRENKAHRDGLEPCITCGRGVAEGKGFLIVITDGGSTILHPAAVTPEVQRDPGYMGGYVIGSSCVRGIPAGFRTAWSGSYS